jgi:hypothetical protein
LACRNSAGWIKNLHDRFGEVKLKAESGNGLVPGFGSPIQKADYDWFLGHVFEEGRQLANLEEAVEALPSDSRKTRQVILGIPYPSETHSNETRSDMASHFVSEAVRRFDQGHFACLHLNGFYWLEETVSGKDLSLIKEVAEQVHTRHLKFYWIPYFSAKGQEDWRACGFDCAMLQPNYAFRNVKPNRFEEAEAKRRNLGMTIEMEIARYTRNRPESPAWKDSSLKYVAAGMKHHWAALDCVGYYGNDLVKMSRQPQDSIQMSAAYDHRHQYPDLYSVPRSPKAVQRHKRVSALGSVEAVKTKAIRSIVRLHFHNRKRRNQCFKTIPLPIHIIQTLCK